MINISKKVIAFIMLLALSLGMGTGAAFGYHVDIDATDDAGYYAGEAAYVQFNNSNPGGVSVPITTADVVTRWTSAQQVIDYAANHGIAWTKLDSAGNIWSTDKIVGDTLAGLSGTQRITPAQSTYLAFQRDTFGWSTYYPGYWWELKITATNVWVNGVLMPSYTFTLGNTTGYNTAQLAFDAAAQDYLDVTFGDGGGSLTFWIYDEGVIDNAGGLSVDVTAVPEPSTLLLLLLGVPFIIRKVRS